MGCWALDDPVPMDDNWPANQYYFPAYRLMPSEETVGDVRWKYEDEVMITRFLKMGEEITWTIYPRT